METLASWRKVLSRHQPHLLSSYPQSLQSCPLHCLPGKKCLQGQWVAELPQRFPTNSFSDSHRAQGDLGNKKEEKNTDRKNRQRFRKADGKNDGPMSQFQKCQIFKIKQYKEKFFEAILVLYKLQQNIVPPCRDSLCLLISKL